MNKLKIFLIVAGCALACTATTMAQDTNLLRTKIGLFEARTGVVLVKGFGQVGSLPLGAEQLSIRCKETTDAGTGEKEYGLMIEVEGGQFGRARVLVDDEEVDSLLAAVDYLSKMDFKVTTLPGFEANYTTKAGFEVIARGIRRDGGVITFLQVEDSPRVAVTSVQMTQLYNLLEQARKNLNALKVGK